jgi:hypothetical protein
MTTPSFRDIEQLSASLDGQLSPDELSHLDVRIRKYPEQSVILADLRQVRAILQHTPKHHLPHNFILTPKMAGIKPPVPRLVPAFSWASAMAMFLFVVSIGSNLIGRLSFGAAAPLMAAAPMANESYGVGSGPVATQAPQIDNTQVLPTSEANILKAPESTPLPMETRDLAPIDIQDNKATQPVFLWSQIWFAVALVFVSIALLIRMASILSFRKRYR